MSKQTRMATSLRGGSELEKANRLLSRRAAESGMVLLRNEGVLPLDRPCPVALFGAGARHMTKGGTGSGEVNNRGTVMPEDGLLANGFAILTRRWLDRLDAGLKDSRKEYIREIRAKTRKIPAWDSRSFFPAFDSVAERTPDLPLIQERDLHLDKTDVGILVITRQAGEGRDRKNVPGDWTLTERELEAARVVSYCYKRSILVINSGSPIDCSFLEECPFKAIIYMGQPGEEGGNALAELLLGKAAFSGKLACSWPERLEDLPSTPEYVKEAGERPEILYPEGIFVGYRFHDASGVPALFPFGYGLSYTSFSWGEPRTELRGGEVTFTCKVRNTGARKGAEILQLYVGYPAGDLPREEKALIGFARSPELAPGEEAVLTIGFSIQAVALYREEDASWVIPAGEYAILVGESSVDFRPVAAIRIAAEKVVERCHNVSNPGRKVSEYVPPRKESSWDMAGIPSVEMDLSSVKTVEHRYGSEEALDPAVAGLGHEELATGLTGTYQFLLSETRETTPGAAGRTRLGDIFGEREEDVVMADGPAGVRLANTYRWKKGKYPKERSAYSEKVLIAKPYLRPVNFFKSLSLMPKRHCWCTAFPAGVILAQSFDLSLLEEVGTAVAKEMEMAGIDIWLAPGMNIQRNPFCGRNFEYFSEDPVLTGKLAAAITKGVARIPGRTCTLKHYAANNREDGRMKSDSVLDERVLREIYLKAFGIAIHEGAAIAVMTSYNKINGTYAGSRKDLCEDVLRSEFGFDGFVMSDWECVAPDQAVAWEHVEGGTDLIMPGMDYPRDELIRGLKEGKADEPKLRLALSRIVRACRRIRGR